MHQVIKQKHKTERNHDQTRKTICVHCCDVITQSESVYDRKNEVHLAKEVRFELVSKLSELFGIGHHQSYHNCDGYNDRSNGT